MIHAPIPISLLLAASAVAPGGGTAAVMQYSQFSIHQRIIIRVPRIPDQPAPIAKAADDRAPRWRERKSAKCIPVTAIAGASFARADTIDLVLVDGRRLRARFNNKCTFIDFYSGFYLKPTADGALCARRDVIKSRAGHDCRIESFRELVRRR